MSGELTMLVIRLVFLAMMWIFIFSIIYALRSDLFGSRSQDYQKAMEQQQSRQQTYAAAPQQAPVAVGAGAPAAAASEPAELTRLVITSGPRRGEELSLSQAPISIGRASDSDLVISDDYTSTRHARLLNWDGRWMLQDLDSTNGTFVNGERVSQPTELRRGVSVRIGTTSFELQ